MEAPAEVMDYTRTVTEVAAQVLGDDLAGVYLTGSLALGDFVASRSDIDLLVVARDETARSRLARFADCIEHPRLWCPAAGLELIAISRSAAGAVPSEAVFLLEVNTGRELPHLTNFDPTGRPRFWYLLDRDVARQSGMALSGPPAAETISPLPRPTARRVITESLEYQSAHLEANLPDSAILNACRSLRFVREDRWYSKRAAGRWALTIPDLDTGLVARALDAHGRGRGEARSIAVDAARSFLEAVLAMLSRGSARDS